ncbi:hypothetical protein ACE0DR_11345 [Azotobacter sp. CWF10]
MAIFSNSGGFSTTITQYLRMAGWGTSTVISSGKDVYIQYAAPEFAYALGNDERSKAAVLYCEPGVTTSLMPISPSRWWPAWWAGGKAS